MKVRFTRRARTDIDEIYSFLHHQSPAAADAVLSALEDGIGQVADFPDLAPSTDEPAVRELSLARYPYKICYEVAGGEVRVLHVRDARRKQWTREPNA